MVSALQQIQTGESTWVLAGGMENMSQAPHVIRAARAGLRLGQGALEDSLMAALKDTMCGCFMAQTRITWRRHNITRMEQDEYALRSHRLGNEATRNGRFAEEIVPVEVKLGKKTVTVDKDDHLSRAPRSKACRSSSPPSDPSRSSPRATPRHRRRAAALVVTSAEQARAAGKTPLGTIRATRVWAPTPR